MYYQLSERQKKKEFSKGSFTDSLIEGDLNECLDTLVEILYQNKNKKNFVTGIISNLSEGMMVEVPCHVGINGVEPLNIGEIPTFQKGLLENQFAYEKLTVDACLEGSYKHAWNALTLNRCVNDTDVAKAILDDYIIANKEFWPELK